MNKIEKWLYGLASGVIGGSATSLSAQAGLAMAHTVVPTVQMLDFKQLGIIALAGGFWAAVAYLMKSPLPPMNGDTTPPFPIPPKSLLLLIALSLCGCAYVRVYDKDKQVGFSSMMPAWPWQDSTAVIERVQFSSKSNAFTASVRGLNESENTSTNAAAMIEAVSKGAIEGAVKALKP